MKLNNKRSQPSTSTMLEKTMPSENILRDIQDLTVEDVVVIYAYAEAIVETVREPLIILDKNLNVKTANKSFFDTFEVKKKDTYNKPIFDIGNKQWNIPRLKKLLTEILEKSSSFNDFEVQHRFEDIGYKTMLLNARRIVLEGHKTELILLAIEDITHKKIVEKHKDDFIAVASHEIKTPLTSIKTFVQILQSHNRKTQDKKNILILDKILKQVDGMENIMASFINIYTIQTGKLKLHKENFLIDNLIKDVVGTFKYSTKTHSFVIKAKSSKKLFADKEKIGQILTNLLTNAIKYSPYANKIIIIIEENEKDVTVSVQDFGLGIPKEQQKMIFERFFRADMKTREKIKGLGLGLYVANQIIKAHKGKMWVKSEVGKGSTVSFSLPLKRLPKLKKQ